MDLDILYKAEIFALFAVPAVLIVGLAELGKFSDAAKVAFYILGGLRGLAALSLPFVGHTH